MAKIIPNSQALHEYLSMAGSVRGKDQFVRNMTGQDPHPPRLGGPETIPQLLIAQRSRTEGGKAIESRALGEMNPRDWKAEIIEGFGIKVVEMPAGRGPSWEEGVRRLGLDAEGGLALAILAHYMPGECKAAAPALGALLAGQTIQAGSEASLAGALFTLHLARHGVDGMFEDLQMTPEFVRKMSQAPDGPELEEVRAQLRRIQFNYIQYVADGSQARPI